MCKCKSIPVVLSVIIIALMAVGHLIRFIWHVPVIVGTFTVPLWFSGVCFIILGLLAAWSFKDLYACCRGSCSCSTDKTDRQL